MNHIEGEEVARHVNRNGAWPQIDENLCEPDNQPSFSTTAQDADATRTTTLPLDQISGYLRLFAFIRGYAPFSDISASAYASR